MTTDRIGRARASMNVAKVLNVAALRVAKWVETASNVPAFLERRRCCVPCHLLAAIRTVVATLHR